jgi:hypothetical protein
VIAIDGKTSRGSKDAKNAQSPLHLVSAWACANRPVLGQEATAEKSGSPCKSMQVDFYQWVTKIGATNRNLQVNDSWVKPIAIAGVRYVHFFGISTYLDA